MQRARHSKTKEEMGVCYKRNVILQKIFKENQSFITKIND